LRIEIKNLKTETKKIAIKDLKSKIRYFTSKYVFSNNKEKIYPNSFQHELRR